jgi:hypothetical protein
VRASETVADPRRKVIERIDALFVDPDIDARFCQSIGEGIDLRLVLARVADEQPPARLPAARHRPMPLRAA